jgi:hypothetical protein
MARPTFSLARDLPRCLPRDAFHIRPMKLDRLTSGQRRLSR